MSLLRIDVVMCMFVVVVVVDVHNDVVSNVYMIATWYGNTNNVDVAVYVIVFVWVFPDCCLVEMCDVVCVDVNPVDGGDDVPGLTMLWLLLLLLLL